MDNSATFLRQQILESTIDEPLLFSQVHRNWGPCKSSLEQWGSIFGDQQLQMRCGDQVWNHMVNNIIYIYIIMILKSYSLL